jgi:hypothetical protein
LRSIQKRQWRAAMRQKSAVVLVGVVAFRTIEEMADD